MILLKNKLECTVQPTHTIIILSKQLKLFAIFKIYVQTIEILYIELHIYDQKGNKIFVLSN